MKNSKNNPEPKEVTTTSTLTGDKLIEDIHKNIQELKRLMDDLKKKKVI
jgi:hypothetical protein